MPAKKVRKSAGSKIVLVPVQRGGSFDFSLGAFKRLGRDIQNPSKVHNFIKKNQIISRAGSLLGNVIPGASKVGEIAGKLGYGKKKQKGAGRKRAIRT